MNRVILIVIAALALCGTANAQVLEKSTWPLHSVIASSVVVNTAVAPPSEITTEALVDSGRPSVPEPPSGLGRVPVPCGGATLCPGQSPIPAPRPTVPTLVTLTTELVLDSGNCYIRFTGDVVGFPNGEFVTFGVRNYGSTGIFVTAYSTFTFQGNAVIQVPVRGVGGEYQAAWGAERSNVVTVSNAFPLICGA